MRASSEAGRRRGPAAASGSRPTVTRCAVYTRKSSEEGLEQEYNSLHAQREACEAYIRSQQHEGWRLVPTPYDDGGISGGTMDRPALQALLAEVRAGRVDVIVVYKVDRLTRSLADFGKMVEMFDAVGASFVAVTQQFNTTTSMGRLTLNVLLSFAQFEREVTSERIRDKIAASKRKGMWMGGRTPLGYLVRERKLTVEPAAAARVVGLYQRYLELGSVQALKAELDAQGVTSRPDGETPFSRGALYALLSNPVYIGQVRHKEERHPGQHEGIVPAALYAAVQARLAAGNNGGSGSGKRQRAAPSLLAGKLFDETGERLTPTHTRKGERRYRYYVSASLLRGRSTTIALTGAPAQDDKPEPTAGRNRPTRLQHVPGVEAATIDGDPTGWRVPAQDIEQNVMAATLAALQDEATVISAALAAGLPADDVPRLRTALVELCRHDGTGPTPQPQRERLLAIVARVQLSADGMTLTLVLPATKVGEDGAASEPIIVEHCVPQRVRRRGMEMRLVLGGGIEVPRHDPALLKVVARGRCWFDALIDGRVGSAKALAAEVGVDVRYVQRLLRLAMLAPSVVEAIAAGRHEAGLTVDALAERGPLPLRWSEQVEQVER